MLDVKEKKEVTEFPVMVTKTRLAVALKMSPSTLQDTLNRKYFDDLVKLGYKVNDKFINRSILHYLREKLSLLPEDFKR